ncbi:HAAS signaling domain-containing protein [Ornithinimicrobium sp. Y1694]|uniref:HAAS signaling domain-containing protein n=1 Tax=Ornithinimicrobium sp. Y1694 TaxID=3418590 RepID=UPI003CF68DFB
MTVLQHPLVVDYLSRLRAEAGRRLSQGEASELLTDIEGHLAEALGANPQEVRVREVLDRLGEPEEVVAATSAPAESGAGAGAAGWGAAAGGASSVGGAPSSGPQQAARREGAPWESLAGIFLVISAVLFPVWFLSIPMWVAGLVFIALSHRWDGGHKVLAVGAWGSLLPMAWIFIGYAGMMALEQSCAGEGCEVQSVSTGIPLVGVVVLAALVVYLVFVVWATRRLIRAAGR